MSSHAVVAKSTGGVTGYVNAGGRGTRLNTVFTPDTKIGVTKAMLRVGSPGLALVEHQVNRLLAAGVDNVVVGVGDHEIVAHHVAAIYGANVRVSSVYTSEQLGNGGDLLRAVQENPELFLESVIITNVDTILDWDEGKALAAHRESRADLTITLTLNKGVPNEGAFYVDDQGRVLYSRESSTNAMTIAEAECSTSFHGSSTGAIIVDVGFLQGIKWSPLDGALSLYKDIVAAALGKRSLYAYDNGERFFIDVGTVDAWERIQRFPEILMPYLSYPYGEERVT